MNAYTMISRWELRKFVVFVRFVNGCQTEQVVIGNPEGNFCNFIPVSECVFLRLRTAKIQSHLDGATVGSGQDNRKVSGD